MELSPTAITLGAIGLLAAGAGGTMAYVKRKELLKLLKDNVEPMVTFTSGGGPGIGGRLKGTPFVADIDPTGPGAGVLLPFSWASKAMDHIPGDKAKQYSKVMKDVPGSLYVGMEMAGPIPIPHLGIAATTGDKEKLKKTWARLKKTASLRDMINKEALQIPLKKGDVILGGRFKNRREIVKEITTDENGQFLVNGKKLLNFRIESTLPDEKKSSVTRKGLEKKATGTVLPGWLDWFGVNENVDEKIDTTVEDAYKQAPSRMENILGEYLKKNRNSPQAYAAASALGLLGGGIMGGGYGSDIAADTKKVSQTKGRTIGTLTGATLGALGAAGSLAWINHYMNKTAEEVGHNLSCALGIDMNMDPSEAQKESENYKKAHVNIDGMNISIENPVGSMRSGMDENGNEWECPIKADYGYVKGSVGYDKDHVDVTIKPGYQGGKGTVYIVNQVDDKGAFDEHKCVLGADNDRDAEAIYNSNYEPGWDGCGSIASMPIDEFKKWVTSEKPRQGEAEVKPMHKIAADYTIKGERVQGVGLRKTFHKLLEDRKLKGLAVNNPISGEVELSVKGDDKKVNDAFKTLGKILKKKTGHDIKIKPAKHEQPFTKINLDEEKLDKLRQHHYDRYLTVGKAAPDRPQEQGTEFFKDHLIERFMLKKKGKGLAGTVPENAAKQLRGEIYPYKWMYTNPERSPEEVEALREKGRKIAESLLEKAAEENPLIAKAKGIATKQHEGVNRKFGGGAYIEHPTRVSAKLQSLGARPELVAAALLHDVVEDTDMDLEGLTTHVGPDVAKLVNEVTNRKIEGLKRAEQKQKDREHLATISQEGRRLKLADRIDNLRDLHHPDVPADWKAKYITESELLLNALKGTDPGMEMELMNRITELKGALV